jgi:hypothetical protein
MLKLFTSWSDGQKWPHHWPLSSENLNICHNLVTPLLSRLDICTQHPYGQNLEKNPYDGDLLDFKLSWPSLSTFQIYKYIWYELI